MKKLLSLALAALLALPATGEGQGRRGGFVGPPSGGIIGPAESTSSTSTTSTTTLTSTTSSTTSSTTTTVTPIVLENWTGFESGDSIETQLTNNTWSVENTQAHTGTYSLRGNYTTSDNGYYALGTYNNSGVGTTNVKSAIFERFWFRYTTKPAANNEPLNQWRASASTVFELRLDSAGRLSLYDSTAGAGTTGLIATGATVLSANTWYLIEVNVNVGAAGAYSLKINTVSELSGTANFGVSNGESARWGKPTNRNSQTVDWYFDDIAVSSTTAPHPDGVGEFIYPNASGDNTQWTTGTGTTFAELDETPPDDDTSYIASTGSAGVISSFGITDATDVTGLQDGVLYGVKTAARCKTPSGTSSMKVRLKSGATTSETTGSSLGASYVARLKVFATDPNTGAAWTIPGFDSIEVGANEVNAVTDRCTTLGVSIDYVPGSAVTTTSTTTTTTSSSTTTVAPPPASQSWSPEAEDTTTILRVQGVGIQSEYNKTEDQAIASGQNPYGYPMTVRNARKEWYITNPSHLTYDFSSLLKILYESRANDQIANIRNMEADPPSSIWPPSWIGTFAASYLITHNEGGGAGRLAYWQSATMRSKYLLYLQAQYTALGWHPAFGPMDNGIGIFNEQTYSGSSYTGRQYSGSLPANEIPPALSAGQQPPFPDIATQTAHFNNHATAFPGKVMMTDAADLAGFNYAIGTLHNGTRGDCWGWTTSQTSCTGDETPNQFMCKLYARTFATTTGSNFSPSQSGSWMVAPTYVESCGYTTGWTQGANIQASIDWAVNNGVTGFSIKGRAGSHPTQWQSGLRRIGPRYVPLSISHDLNVTAGNNLTVSSTWRNRGNAPLYNFGIPQYLLYKLVAKSGDDVIKINTGRQAFWLPNQNYVVSDDLAIPTWADATTYDLYVGIGEADYSPHTPLAITTSQSGLWYGPITQVAVANGAPAADPTEYSCNFSTDAKYLDTPDNDPMSFNGTDLSGCAHFVAPTVNDADKNVLVGKGTVESSGEFFLYNPANSDKLRFQIYNGSTLHSVTTTASLVAGTKYAACFSFNNTTKEMRLRLGNNAVVTATASGSIPNGVPRLSIGRDNNASNGWNEKARRIRLWKRLLTTAEEDRQIAGVGFSDMTLAERRYLYVNVECDEVAAGNRTDEYQYTTWEDHGSTAGVAW